MTDSDQALLQTFTATRDGEVFAQLVGRHSGLVFGVCRRVLGDRALAEDAAQETFLHLLRQPAQVTGSLVGWLHRVAHGKAVDLVRREVAQDKHRKAAPLPDPVPEASWAEISPLMDQALQELPDEVRTILIQHFLEGRGQEELAAEHGMSQPTISRRLATGVAELRTILTRKGVVAAVLTLLAPLLTANACEAAPATLIAELGKMALASQVGLGAAGQAVAAKSAVAPGLFGAKSVLVATLVLGGIGGIAAGIAVARAPAPTAGQAAEWRRLGDDPAATAAAPAPAIPVDAQPADNRVARLVTLAVIPTSGEATVVGTAIAPDRSVLVAVNAVQVAPLAPAVALGPQAPVGATDAAQASVLRLAPDGREVRGRTSFGPGHVTLKRAVPDAAGGMLLVGVNHSGADLGGGPAPQPGHAFLARLAPAGDRMVWILYRAGISDVAVDGDEVVVLHDATVSRFACATGAERWTRPLAGWGANHPGGLTVLANGATAVVGYSMTRALGRQFKNPYVQTFTRDGTPRWTGWHVAPTAVTDEATTADATGRRALAMPDGSLLALFWTDGGNTMLGRDPAAPTRPLPTAATAGVHQAGPGYGFRGPHRVSGVFRFAADDGRLDRSTWLSAWENPRSARSLVLDDAVGDRQGRVVAVGGSADGCPLRSPWFVPADPAQAGGGCIVVLDRECRLLQSGTFPHMRFSAVTERDGWVVAAGRSSPDLDQVRPEQLRHPNLVVSASGSGIAIAVFQLQQ